MSIIVGVDGSAHARAALSWAIEEARLRGTDVVAVHAYSPPPSYRPYGHLPGAGDPPRDEELRRGAQDLVTNEIASVGHGDVDVQVTIVEDSQPARALTEQARREDLVVVGSRGHAALAGLLVGSVSQRCLQLAPCPVVVVHAED